MTLKYDVQILDIKEGGFFGIAVSEETIPFKTKFEEKPYSVMRVWN